MAAVVTAATVGHSGSLPPAEATATNPAVPDTAPTVRLVIDDPGATVAAARRTDANIELLTPDFGAVTVDPNDVNRVVNAAFDAGATTVEPDVVALPAAVIPTDPGWGAWWGAVQAGLPDAWVQTLGSPTVAIGIVDTGVAPVGELAGKLRPGFSAFTGQLPTSDTDGHGTRAAMVAAGAINNGLGAAGSCPGCEIIPLKVIEDFGTGALLSHVADAINWATANGADIINVSLVAPATLTVLNQAITNAMDNGVVVVASAGNNGGTTTCDPLPAPPCATTPMYPAATPGVISVAGLWATGQLAGYSSRGSTVEVAVAGTNVVANTQPGTWVNFSGTSSAAPLLAGMIGLLRTLDPDMGPTEVRCQLQMATTMPSPKLDVAWGAAEAPALLEGAGAWPCAPFGDVARPSYYGRAVDWAWDESVTTGTSATTFSPTASINRAQAVGLLWRLAGEPAPTNPNPFTDIPPGAWFTDAAVWAYGEGITTGAGSPDRFNPQGSLTRAQAVTLLWRYENEPTPTTQAPFTDVPPGAWFASAADWAFSEGITTGKGSPQTFAPADTANRAQHITMLWRWQGAPIGPGL